MTTTQHTVVGRVNFSADDIFKLIEAKPFLSCSDSELEQLFWTMHPRFRFFKTVPQNCVFLDIGANNGGLHFWREWGAPKRSDITMYGVDLQHGEHAGHYAGWESFNLDERQPSFPGVKFDAFYATHLIEHLANLDQFLAYMESASAPGARVFFEWPAPRTKDFPSSALLRERGFDIQTYNFFDDYTHVDTYSLDAIGPKLEQYGFHVTEIGEIDIGQVAVECIARGRASNNLTFRQLGLWCATGWSNYVSARRQS
ncbi:MAG: class I SAM-dependent methyltransferase [Alphaproteobacteria bacterium]|nr:class I SAM-dependent methyltransferase [Alphaproteobacteria bacterium]